MPNDPTHTIRCNRCMGTGWLAVAEPECNGGRCAERCDRCGGSGRLAVKSTIPAGFVLMPREAKPELVAAWWRAKNRGGSDDDAYRAMVCAAEDPQADA